MPDNSFIEPDKLFIRFSDRYFLSFAAMSAPTDYYYPPSVIVCTYRDYFLASDLDILNPVTANAICSYNLFACGLSAATRSFISNTP